jgi:SAM-dependent methyltransferase
MSSRRQHAGPEAGPQAAQRVADGFAAAADEYDATGTEFFGVMGEHLVAQADIRPGAVVLDIGCGKGAVTLPAGAARAAGPGGQVTGIDLAVPMLDHARRATEQGGLAMVTFGLGDTADPPFPAGSFDVVLAGNLAQFLPSPMTEIARWGSLLTGGGTLAFSWNLAEDPYWVPVLAVFDAAMPPGVTGFAAMLRRRPFGSVEDVQGLLAASGYQPITTRVHTVALTYRTPQQWWAAARSQGPWAACWRHIPPGRLDAAQRDAFALLDERREPDGTIGRTMLFAWTTGRKDTP